MQVRGLEETEITVREEDREGFVGDVAFALDLDDSAKGKHLK